MNPPVSRSLRISAVHAPPETVDWWHLPRDSSEASIEPIRVLHVINQLADSGGAEISLRENILGSSIEGLDHGVAVLRAENSGIGPLQRAGVPVFVPRPRRQGRLADIQHVRRVIRAFRPTLIHTSLADADLAGRIAAFLERTPVLTSLVNTPYGKEAVSVEPAHQLKLELVRLADRLLARQATTAFHAISQATAEHAMLYLHAPKSLIRVVPRGRSRQALGEPTDERRRSVRQTQGWADRPVVINVAREEPQKGHVLLLEAFVEVLAANPYALLVIAGRGGRSSAAISRRIAQLGLNSSVQRLGVRQDIADLVAAADVFAFSSLYEGLGGAVIEAAGVGTPIVSFDVPAVREVLGDTHPWLVPVGDYGGLSRAIIEVLMGGQHVADVVRTQRDRFLAYYELEACISGMSKLYHDFAAALPKTSSLPIRRVPRLSVPW